MPRSIWEGSISFGLVHIPIGLSTTSSSKRIRFHQLHDEDGVRIRQARMCPAHGEEVPYEHIVKGYEIAPDRYVVITPEELDSLEPERSRTIELEKFVQIDDIDPMYFDSSYYVNPKKNAAKPYELLRDAMKEADRAGVARFVMRSKEYLVALWPRGDHLVLSTLKFSDEIVDPEPVAPGKEDKPRRKGELAAAQQLIEALADEFDPTEYHDEYRERVMELIEAKAEGREFVSQPTAPPPTTAAPDLMAALERSIAAAVGEGKKPRKRARRDSHPRTPEVKGAKKTPAAKKPAAKAKTGSKK
ncbi:MAG TPA: Ku protein [Solirubrobacterales bacterium]|jgi:DNA end-binding protein Ku|nr:Ku protein [Solirubrobacterales bacterium]